MAKRRPKKLRGGRKPGDPVARLPLVPSPRDLTVADDYLALRRAAADLNAMLGRGWVLCPNPHKGGYHASADWWNDLETTQLPDCVRRLRAALDVIEARDKADALAWDVSRKAQRIRERARR